jgi:hypothetical protein
MMFRDASDAVLCMEEHCRYTKEHLPLSCSFQRAFAVTMLFAKSICRYHALCNAKSICRYHALSHNGNALFIALSLFFGIFFLCSSKEQQHDEWHLF